MVHSSLKDGVSKFDSASIEGGFQLIQGSQIYEQHILPKSDELEAAKTSSHQASTMKGDEASKEAESHKREDKEVMTKTENSEYAVLIPENVELKEPVVEAEVLIHHRSR